MTNTPPVYEYDKKKQYSVLSMNTLAFTVNFAVWTMFSVIGIKIKGELGLSETEFGLLIATPILTGSLVRLPLGLSDRPVWRAPRLFYPDAPGRHRNLWIAFCRPVLAVPGHRSVHRFGRWFVRHRHRLHLGLVRAKSNRVSRWAYSAPATRARR